MNEEGEYWGVTCPHCGAQSELPTSWANRRIKCKACSRTFQFEIPTSGTPQPVEDAADGGMASDQSTPAPPLFDHAAHRLRRTWKNAVRRQFVPSTSFLDIFDLTFRKYITPWVVRVTWAFALYVAIAYLAVVGLIAASAAFAPDVKQTVKPAQELAKQIGGGKEESALPAQLPLKAARKPDQRARPEVVTPSIEFAFPEYLQESVFAKIASALIYYVQIIAVIIGLLWVRVALEGVIVLFNISLTLNSIDEAVHRTNS
jgi:ribosomal protein S27E